VVQSGRCEWGLVTSGKSAMSFLIAYPSPRARGCSLEAGAWGKGRALRNRMRKSRWWTRSDFVMPLFLALALSAPARASDALLGYVDGLRPQGNGDLNLVGWACARGVSTPLHVDLYVGGSFGHGGTLIGRFLANQVSEPAVAAACGASSGAFRFSIALTSATQAQYPSQALFVHALSRSLDENLLLVNSGLYTLPLLGNGDQVVSIGTPGGAGWAADSLDYFAKWKCQSPSLKRISRLKIMPLGNHGASQWKDSLVSDSSLAGVSSHAGTVTDFVYNDYGIAGWGPMANSANGKIPGVNGQRELFGSGPLGLTSIKSIINNMGAPLGRTCIHMNPSLFDYDGNGVPHAFIATVWSGDLKTACKLPSGGFLPKSGPYVYRYVNNAVGWQLDMTIGLVEDQGGLDLQMNADPLQPSVIVRADWSGKVMQVTLTPRAISTVLDCSAGGVHFAEASRGPNGAYYFLADEAPYKGPDIQQLVAEVYQHDVFVAF
jgi:hypothetical protein